MSALLVYESMFGNTKAVAEAVLRGLAASGIEADFVEVSEAPRVLGDDVSVLIAAGPTHAFGLSRDRTRADAAKQAIGGLVSSGLGLREWIAGVKGTARPRFATFDTKVRRPRLPGSAARAAAKQLRRRGWSQVLPSATFYVSGTQGPLLPGEIERAERWGRELASAMSSVLLA
jgi:hypothetical protein